MLNAQVFNYDNWDKSYLYPEPFTIIDTHEKLFEFLKQPAQFPLATQLRKFEPITSQLNRLIFTSNKPTLLKGCNISTEVANPVCYVNFNNRSSYFSYPRKDNTVKGYTIDLNKCSITNPQNAQFKYTTIRSWPRIDRNNLKCWIHQHLENADNEYHNNPTYKVTYHGNYVQYDNKNGRESRRFPLIDPANTPVLQLNRTHHQNLAFQTEDVLLSYHLEAASTIEIPCTCDQQCTVFLDVSPITTIIDGFLTKSDIDEELIQEIKSKVILSREWKEHYGKYLVYQTKEYIYWKNANNTRMLVPLIGNGIRTYNFNQQLTIITDGATFHPFTVPYVYCTAPRGEVTQVDTNRPTQIPTPPATIILSDGSRKIWDGSNFYEDPQFISEHMTLNPTEGSCRLVDGYEWKGDFKPSTKPVGWCTFSNNQTYYACKADQLVPKTLVYLTPKTIEHPPINCQYMCVNPRSCTTDELTSPLYQACIDIASKIHLILGTPLPKGIPLNVTKPPEIKKSTIVHIQEVAIAKFEQQKPEVQETLNRLNKLKAMFKSQYTTDKYHLPELEQASKDLGLFLDAAFNTRKDMDHIAGLPWLAGWRFGRQINLLSASMRVVIAGIEGTIKQVNQNFDAIKDSIAAISQQVQNNYKSITQSFNNFRTASETVFSNLNLLLSRINNAEYMAAKLAQLNTIYANLKVQQKFNQIQLELTKVRTAACRTKSPICHNGQGMYLSHSEYEDDKVHILTVYYLGPKTCILTKIQPAECIRGKLHIPPYGCIYENGVLVNKMDDTQQCGNVTIIQGCNITRGEVDTFQQASFFHVLKPRNISEIPLPEFKAQIGDIAKFNQSIANAIDRILNINTLDKYIDADFANALDRARQTFNSLSVTEIIKIALILIFTLITLSLLAKIITACCSKR